MPADTPITDLLVLPLQPEEGGLTLLSNQQHLLRRFGQLQLLELAPGQRSAASLKGEADRFYFVIAGEARIALEDLREHSPSRGAKDEVTLAAEQPQGLLAPFGVAVRLSSERGARVIVVSTHSEAHPADGTVA